MTDKQILTARTVSRDVCSLDVDVPSQGKRLPHRVEGLVVGHQ